MCVNGVQNPLLFQQCSLVFVQFGAMVKQFMTLEPRIPVPSMITHDLIVSCWNCHQYVPRDWTQNLDSMEPQWWFISRGHHQIRGFLYLWVRFWILCCMNILRKWDNEMNRYGSTIVLVSSSGPWITPGSSIVSLVWEAARIPKHSSVDGRALGMVLSQNPGAGGW